MYVSYKKNERMKNVKAKMKAMGMTSKMSQSLVVKPMDTKKGKLEDQNNEEIEEYL